ncbi:hypothetical protein FOZ63_003156 [Perkinsus olseni]|uniref:Uncharacterized protein n=1 Tax=Perkinsus olseni TaxID=32597 RepID=A0A7J6RKA2_PEROL|nr:hypothetical protein FOZ60_012773 [Perkinsus olseni]KAF4695057.1 hypothetical protein FOZ63_003156 [Perkinsus olseni]KAF4720632.1 hypothetical protein FOZ62_011441 [Perkinsus olseni]
MASPTVHGLNTLYRRDLCINIATTVWQFESAGFSSVEKLWAVLPFLRRYPLHITDMISADGAHLYSVLHSYRRLALGVSQPSSHWSAGLNPIRSTCGLSENVSHIAPRQELTDLRIERVRSTHCVPEELPRNGKTLS